MPKETVLPPDEILHGTRLLNSWEVLTKMLEHFPDRKVQDEINYLKRILRSDPTNIARLREYIQQQQSYLAQNESVLNWPLLPDSPTELKQWEQILLGWLILINREITRAERERKEIERRDALALRAKVIECKAVTLPQAKNYLTRLESSFSAKSELYKELPYTAAFKYHPDGILWGGHWYPWEAASHGLLVVGAQGTGKTAIIKLLMKSVLPHIGKRRNHRAVIYDFKHEIYPYLVEIGVPRERIKILNPLDKRCVGWAIWKDVKKRSTAQQIGQILIPADKEDHVNSYFKNAARDLLVGVMTVFVILSNEREKKTGKPIEWTLRDVFLAMKDEKTLRSVLERTEETRDIITDYFEPEQTFKSVWATAKTYVKRLSIVAALWGHAKEYISLSDWAKDINLDESIIIIGSDPAHDATISALNRVILQRISEILRSQNKDKLNPRVTWLFLDELPQLGRVESLDDLFGVGREKGICPVLGIQDPAQLEKEGRYKEKEAEVILNLSKNKIMLGVEGDTAREWCSKQFGDVERRKSLGNSNRSTNENWGENWGSNKGNNWSTNESQNKGTNWNENKGTNWNENEGTNWSENKGKNSSAGWSGGNSNSSSGKGYGTNRGGSSGSGRGGSSGSSSGGSSGSSSGSSEGGSSGESEGGSKGGGYQEGGGMNEQRVIERLIMPNKFAAIDVERAKFIPGYVQTPYYGDHDSGGAYRIEIPLSLIKTHLEINNDAVAYEERDDPDDEKLGLWGEEDFKRLGFEGMKIEAVKADKDESNSNGSSGAGQKNPEMPSTEERRSESASRKRRVIEFGSNEPRG
jgi:hypothetical protein